MSGRSTSVPGELQRRQREAGLSLLEEF